MKKRLTKKASLFKGNNFTAEDELYVGIDVHKEQYHVAIWAFLSCYNTYSTAHSLPFKDSSTLYAGCRFFPHFFAGSSFVNITCSPVLRRFLLHR